jgi:DNA-binding IclR family transcriptional regulator
MVMSTLSIRQVARPMMVELARQTDETIALNTVNGRDRVCIESIDTPSQLASLVRPGQSMRLNDRGAIHKTLMAYLPEKERDRLVAELTKGNPRKRAEMLAGIARVRKDGYSVTHSERVLGLTAIAAPIWDSNDTGNYAVAISGPTVRMEPRINEFVGLLLKSTSDISRRLGATTPPATVGAPVTRAKKTNRRPDTGLANGKN